MCTDSFDEMLKKLENRVISKILSEGMSEENIVHALKIAVKYTSFITLPPEKQVEVLLGINEICKEEG